MRLALLSLLAAFTVLGCRSTNASEPDAAPPAAPAEAATNVPARVEVVDAGPPTIIDAGSDAAPADAGAPAPPAACPPGMARIGRVCVDAYEAHLATLGADGALTPHPHYQRPEPGVFYEARSEPGFHPQAYISRVEAAAACANAGKRLCSKGEWTRACKGSKGTRWPYGNKGRRGVCNTGKPHLLTIMHGGKGRNWTYEAFNDPRMNQEPGFLAKSGEYADCHGPEGVYDLIGNLHEWVSDTVGDDIEDILARDEVERRRQPWKVGNGIFMGGFFSTTDEHGPGCTFITIAHEPTYHDYSTGFRCCKDVPKELWETPAGKAKKK